MGHRKIIITTGTEHTYTYTDEEQAVLGAGMPDFLSPLMPAMPEIEYLSTFMRAMPRPEDPDWHAPLTEPTLVAVPAHVEEEDDDEEWIYDIDIYAIICKETEHYYGDEPTKAETDEYLNKALKSINKHIDLFKTDNPPTSLPDVAHIIGVNVTRHRHGDPNVYAVTTPSAENSPEYSAKLYEYYLTFQTGEKPVPDAGAAKKPHTARGQSGSLPTYRWDGPANTGNRPQAPAPAQVYGNTPEYGGKVTTDSKTAAHVNHAAESKKESSIDLGKHNSGYVKDEKLLHDVGETNSYTLGSLSEHYESGGHGAGTVSGGKGDPGGVSYGTYQLSSKYTDEHGKVTIGGTVKEFINSHEGAQWKDQLNGLTPGSADFSIVWRNIATKDPNAFRQAQHNFIERSHYQPLVVALNAKLGYDVNKSSDVMKDVIWSTAVQHGPKNSLYLIKESLHGDDITKMQEAEIIKDIYAERGKMNKETGRLAHFKHTTSERTVEGLVNRFKSEKEKALKRLKPNK